MNDEITGPVSQSSTVKLTLPMGVFYVIRYRRRFAKSLLARRPSRLSQWRPDVSDDCKDVMFVHTKQQAGREEPRPRGGQSGTVGDTLHECLSSEFHVFCSAMSSAQLRERTVLLGVSVFSDFSHTSLDLPWTQ
ncbi:hypothetical protein ElyMa_002083600 [Elysia marginata]|uniref:Uncharacterized protein n=1 Tax=Elysia marginata TaxID=1093978 RepID=A0AAV4FCD5_9GAST|nr:hypothetical protein ElyMa_002083600 [Elysia marginata]